MKTVAMADGLTYKYGTKAALKELDLSIPEGSLFALLGPNGAGKSTLIRILMGLIEPTSGEARVFDKRVGTLSLAERAGIGYVAESQVLPGWMRLSELESYLAPLYPTWDRTLATSLRDRFQLDSGQRMKAMSRGERMKAALLCALAPRPRFLIMDEPFTGIDVMTKDDLVRGVLESAGSEGWTVLLSSHDIAEVELIADSVGILTKGRITYSSPMGQLHSRFKHVDVVMPDEAAARAVERRKDWLYLTHSGAHLQFIDSRSDGEASEAAFRQMLPAATRIEVRPATLREAFVAIAKDEARDREAV